MRNGIRYLKEIFGKQRSIDMKSKNSYSYPINKENIKKIATTESPAHIRYVSKETGETYDSTHAVDFLCDEGSPIKAALDGEVVFVKDDSQKNYNKWEIPTKEEMPESEQDGNHVAIKHDNGEFSVYSHLQYKKVLVKVGQKVKTGDVIGYSGNTGWSIKPHLHFVVFRFLKPMPAKDFESLEIVWKD